MKKMVDMLREYGYSVDVATEAADSQHNRRNTMNLNDYINEAMEIVDEYNKQATGKPFQNIGVVKLVAFTLWVKDRGDGEANPYEA